MPNIEFGTREMVPMSNMGKDETISQHEETTECTKERDTKNGLSELDATMPEADEPDKLEEIPLVDANDNYSKRHVKASKFIGINKVQLTSGSAPRFMFIVELKWSDESVSFISRDHDDFFKYHCWLLDTFKGEAGYKNEPRTIPLLPGKKWFRNNLSLAEERRPMLQSYLNQVIKIKSVCNNRQAQAFFGRRPGDPNEDDPILREAILESENGNEFKWTAENSKLVIDQAEASMQGSHENKTFEADHDDDIARNGSAENTGHTPHTISQKYSQEIDEPTRI